MADVNDARPEISLRPETISLVDWNPGEIEFDKWKQVAGNGADGRTHAKTAVAKRVFRIRVTDEGIEIRNAVFHDGVHVRNFGRASGRSRTRGEVRSKIPRKSKGPQPIQDAAGGQVAKALGICKGRRQSCERIGPETRVARRRLDMERRGEDEFVRSVAVEGVLRAEPDVAESQNRSLAIGREGDDAVVEAYGKPREQFLLKRVIEADQV